MVRRRSAQSRRPRNAASPSAPPADRKLRWLVVRGAAHNNLRTIDVWLPLGRFVCVTGVSGSGKSSLVNDILYKALARDLNGARTTPGRHKRIDGLEHLDKVIAIDQSPIGRTPRSNPATYIKLLDEIRQLFAKLPDAKLRGYKPGRFSFNVSAHKGGGRCEACEGNGANRIEMDFLADLWVTCPVCQGRRFTRETLQIQYKHKSIADVLEMDVQQALEHFENVPRVRRMLQTLHDVGLDYIKLGQPSTTLSGGEAQRVKLARELVKRATGRTLYVLDEPTTGLHFDDIRRLLAVLHGFVDAGNTVVVIEHNLDVVKTADWIIDLGPEGGEAGGRIVAEGTPEQIAECEASHTGAALREVLGGREVHLAGRRPKRRSRSRSAAGGGAAAGGEADAITVVGARQHNLKDVTVRVPREQMTVCTGVSGSGKTSFAIDTVYTEGHRRYVESLSAYARQFLGQMAKPRVDHIEGLSPAICIEQKSASKSPRSTVGTITEIYDYMRVLWARVGTPYCPQCGVPVGAQTIDEICDRIFELDEGAPIIILAPVRLGDGETYTTLFNRLRRSGYLRVRIDGEIVQTAQALTLDARRKHRVEVVVDRTVVRGRNRGRITESVEHALALGDGVMMLLIEAVETVHEEPHEPATPRRRPRVRKTRQRELRFSQKLSCPHCGTAFDELSPYHFSFNSPLGWCETCEGLGVQRGAPQAAIIDRPERSLLAGAIAGWGPIRPTSPLGRMLTALCRRLGVEPDTPLSDWSHEQIQALLFGTTGEWIDADDAFPGVRFHWRGLFPTIDAATRNSWLLRHRLAHIVTDIPCTACRGGRLRADAAAVRLGGSGRPARRSRISGKTIVEVCNLPLEQAAAFFKALRLDARQRRIAGELLHEIRNRLRFLLDVGLGYLTLHRAAPTLSGGEAQRIRLASQIGSGLTGVLYVLDEPTIGLHPRDTARLVRALRKLRRLGNTLLLVEHDRDVIAAADRVLDFGPRAGRFGGRIVAEGRPAELRRPLAGGAPQSGGQPPSAGTCPGVSRPVEGDRPPNGEEVGGQPPSAGSSPELGGQPPPAGHGDGPVSLTRAYLSGQAAIPVPANRRPVDANGWPKKSVRRTARRRGRGQRRGPTAPAAKIDPDAPVSDWLIVRRARQHNLRRIDVPIPLGRFVCVTGVSGSGKSSLVADILYPHLARRLQRANVTPGICDAVEGIDALDKVINVDQSPIGTTPASNPATYTGVFDWIRELFARLPESKLRGWEARRFSFNRPGGRCDACAGQGQRCIEMHFMPDVWVECEVCHGRRYNPETLEVRFKGKSIADVLDLSVAEALELFANVPKVRRMLQTLADVGLDYVQLGQPAPTLSGGEAQRVKLAAELGKPQTGRTFYILDEPTTGLHFDDIRKLLDVIHRLVDLGNTVLVIEHNLDVIKSADFIIDLGPEAGDAGGLVVALGTPEQLAGGQAAEPARRCNPRGVGPLVSHTAAALAPVFEAGPREPRKRYDPRAHAREEMDAERRRFGDVGKGTRMPWQLDGRAWHLRRRTSRDGRPCRWEPEALEYVVELVQQAGRGRFAETNWNNRASVEITAPGARVWFLHALTGGEWLLELYFRVPRGTFDWRRLDAELGLPTLDEREDLETYGDWSRVDVRRRGDGFDAVVLYVYDKAEIDTPAFRRFVKRAVTAYFKGCV